MPAIKLTKEYFSGAGKLYGPKGLSAVLRALAVDQARTRIQIAAVADLTDSTTGTAGTRIANLNVPSAPFNATTAGGAQRTAFNAALVKIENATKTLATAVNNARTRVGLAALSIASGTDTPNVLPAQDKTVATANGTAAVDYRTGRAALNAAKANLQRLIWAMDEVLVAIDAGKLPSDLSTARVGALNLVAIPAPTASGTGASAISKADADAFLTAHANALARIAATWNATMGQAAAAPVTLNVVAG